MKIYMLKMRKRGIRLPKSVVFDRYNRPKFGELTVGNSDDQGLHRICIRGLFVPEGSMLNEILLDCWTVWMEGDRFMLTGIETCKTHEGVADYGQSWLCMLNEPPPPPEGR